MSIRSGGNDPHGSAYWFLRNDMFDSRPLLPTVDRDGDGTVDPEVLRQNMFGGTIGGPIRRNRASYFFSYEGWRVRQEQSDRSTIPTRRERRGDFSETANLSKLTDPLGGVFPGRRIPRSRMDPVLLALMDLYPRPNFADTTRANYV